MNTVQKYLGITPRYFYVSMSHTSLYFISPLSTKSMRSTIVMQTAFLCSTPNLPHALIGHISP